MLEKAIQIALEAHKGQTDKAPISHKSKTKRPT